MSTPPQHQELIAVSSRPMRDSDLVETRKVFSRGADFALIFMVCGDALTSLTCL